MQHAPAPAPSRARGLMLGAAIGDALGAPFEGGPSASTGHVAAELDRRPNYRFTDDAHMLIGLAESLLARGGFDGDHMAHHFARRYDAEPWRGYGSGPPQIFRMVQSGTPWDQAPASLFGGSGSFGNGGAMRVAPVAIATGGDPATTADLAAWTARITHTHPLGVEGAVIQAVAAAFLLHEDSATLDPARLLRDLQGHAYDETFRAKLAAVEELLQEAADARAGAVLGNGIAAHESVPAAIYAALRHPGSFQDAVTFAISLGGDADTIACMAGALSGALLGEDAIPPAWRDNVEDAEHLRSLAERLGQLPAA